MPAAGHLRTSQTVKPHTAVEAFFGLLSIVQVIEAPGAMNTSCTNLSMRLKWHW
jgi:hypothetical protein